MGSGECDIVDDDGGGSNYLVEVLIRFANSPRRQPHSGFRLVGFVVRNVLGVR